MKKIVFIALSFAFGFSSFAQKKELKAAEKAIKGNNYAEAKSALTQAEAMLSSMDAKSKTKFHLLKGKAYYANGAGSEDDMSVATESLANLDASNKDAMALKQTMVNNFITKGSADLELKKYKSAAGYLNQAYRLSPNDTIYLYNAASLAVSANDYDKALSYYGELKDLGYTGVATEFVAKNKETGEVEVFGDKLMRDLSVKGGTHTAAAERKTDSKAAEIVKNVALIYVQQGENEKAIEAMAEARANNPNDVNLILTEANVHYKMGNNDKFKELLEKAAVMDPENVDLQYNLGVVAMDSGDTESAKKYYEKAVELNPKYTNAYINLASLVLSKEEALINEMNNLGTSSADNKRYDELTEQRKQLYLDAVPYLEKVLGMDDKNIQAAKTLMNIYSQVGEDAKFKEMKMKVDTLESGN